MLGSLRPKMCHKEANLSLKDLRGQWYVQIRLAEITIPFGNLVLKDHVITECIPSMPRNLAMILVRIIVPMRKYEIWIYLLLEARKPPFNFVSLSGKETILELHHLDAGA